MAKIILGEIMSLIGEILEDDENPDTVQNFTNKQYFETRYFLILILIYREK